MFDHNEKAFQVRMVRRSTLVRFAPRTPNPPTNRSHHRTHIDDATIPSTQEKVAMKLIRSAARLQTLAQHNRVGPWPWW